MSLERFGHALQVLHECHRAYLFAQGSGLVGMEMSGHLDRLSKNGQICPDIWTDTTGSRGATSMYLHLVVSCE